MSALKPTGYVAADQFGFDLVVEESLKGHSLAQLRDMRDALEAHLTEADPKSAELLAHLKKCAPKQSAAALTALLAVTPPHRRGKLRTMRTLALYITARESRECGGAVPAPLAAIPRITALQASLPLPSPLTETNPTTPQ